MVQIPAGARNFSLLQNNNSSSGAHPGSYAVDTGAPFTGRVEGGKQPGQQPSHSPPYCAEVKWSYTSIFQCAFMVHRVTNLCFP
jgi:hypothetical protein